MPTKGNVRRITSKALYHKKISLYRGKIRESEKAEDFASGSARNSASLSLSVSPYSFVAACACLAARSDATCHRQAHVLVPPIKELAKLAKYSELLLAIK